MTIDKEERDTWKLLRESTQWKVQGVVHENNIKMTVSASSYQNKLTYGIAQLVSIHTLLHF